MKPKTIIQTSGIISLTALVAILAVDGVDTRVVITIAAAIVSIAAPEALEKLSLGPFD